MQYRAEFPCRETAKARSSIDRPDHACPTRAGELLGVGAAVEVDALRLKPVPRVAVVVGGGRKPHRVAGGVLVAEDGLFVVRFDPVEGRQAVAPHGIGTEVVVGQAEIALVGDLVGELQLEFDPMARLGWRQRELDRVVAHIETGVIAAPVDGLESVGDPPVGLQQVAEPVGIGPPVGGVQATRTMLSRLDEHFAHTGGGRNRRRNHVERATDRIGALGDRRGTLENFERRHPTCSGKVVRRWRRIGCRCYEHAVLEERYARAALRRDAPDADVGAQAVAVLKLNRNPGTWRTIRCTSTWEKRASVSSSRRCAAPAIPSACSRVPMIVTSSNPIVVDDVPSSAPSSAVAAAAPNNTTQDHRLRMQKTPFKQSANLSANENVYQCQFENIRVRDAHGRIGRGPVKTRDAKVLRRPRRACSSSDTFGTRPAIVG